MRVAISSCLLGAPVRYDGGAKPNAAVLGLDGQAGRGLGAHANHVDLLGKPEDGGVGLRSPVVAHGSAQKTAAYRHAHATLPSCHLSHGTRSCEAGRPR